MKVESIRTPLITAGDNLLKVLDTCIQDLEEGSLLIVTSKIVSICEGNTILVGSADKQKLVEEEADLIFLGSKPYGKNLTIKDGILIPDAGIDESNANGTLILWPKDARNSAEEIRKYLTVRFGLEKVGVIITDSTTTPLRWGTTGIGISFAGFLPLKDYIGAPDLFGRKMEATKASRLDGLAAAAVLVMGENDEQTPLAVITDVPFLEFIDREITDLEQDSISISIEDDLYSPLLANKYWTSGIIKK